MSGISLTCDGLVFSWSSHIHDGRFQIKTGSLQNTDPGAQIVLWDFIGYRISVPLIPFYDIVSSVYKDIGEHISEIYMRKASFRKGSNTSRHNGDTNIHPVKMKRKYITMKWQTAIILDIINGKFITEKASDRKQTVSSCCVVSKSSYSPHTLEDTRKKSFNGQFSILIGGKKYPQ